MKLIMSCLRTIVEHECLSDMALLAVEIETQQKINLKGLINQFAAQGQGK